MKKMGDDGSSSSEDECEAPLIQIKRAKKLKGKELFRHLVLTKVMRRQIFKSSENMLNVEPIVVKTNIQPTLTSRVSSSAEKSQARRDTDILDSAEVRDLEWTKRCLESGSSPEATCKIAKLSVCHIAAYYGDEGIVEELLKSKPELYKSTDKFGRTPLHFAAWEGNLECLGLLLGLKAGDLQKTEKDGSRRKAKEKIYQQYQINNEILQCLNVINGEEARRFTNLCDPTHSCSSPTQAMNIVWHSCTPLHEACARVQTDSVLALLACGADITVQNSEGKTPLDVCGLANLQMGKIQETSGRSFSKIVDAIFRYGKLNNVPKKLWLTNKRDETSPLHIAVILGSKKATKLLLDIGAVPNILDQMGQTPMHLAIDHKRSMILRAIANFPSNVRNHVESVNEENHTPLQYATKQQWIEGVIILLDSNANILNGNKFNGETALHIAAEIGNLQITDILIKKMRDIGQSIDIKNNCGETPLIKAIVSGNPSCVRCFLHEGAAYITDEKYTVLHKAMLSDNEQVLNALLEAEGVKSLVNIVDEKGMTPLHWAAERNKRKYIEILRDNNADACLRTSKGDEYDGYTPLHIAAEKGNNEAIEELLRDDKKYAYEKQCKRTLMNINDNKGWLPFHRAAHNCHKDSIETFLKNGSSLAEIVKSTDRKENLVANIIKDNMPRSVDYFNYIFNERLCINYKDSDRPECGVKFNYSILMNKNDEESKQMTAVEALFGYGSNFELSKMILHPYIESFLFLKWRILRRFYLLILGIYGFYVLLLTDMIINMFHEGYLNWISPKILTVKHIILTVLIIWIIILEIPFIRLNWRKYLKRLEGWIKLSSVLVSLLTIGIYHTLGIQDTRVASAVALLLSWIETTMLLSRFPQFGYYYQMFTTVALRVVKVFALFGFFVVFGYSLIFWILIRENESFLNPWNSFIKTVVMMTSEFDYSSLIQVNSNNENITFESLQTNSVVIQLFFISFLICVPIVLMNLLLALAVSDVKDLKIEGKIQRLQEQVEFLSNLEALAWRINIRISIVEKLRVENEMTVYPGKPYWDSSNNLPRNLMESVCEFIHERRCELEKEQQAKALLDKLESNTELFKASFAKYEKTMAELTEVINQLSLDVMKLKQTPSYESRPSSLWPSLNVLKSGTSKC